MQIRLYLIASTCLAIAACAGSATSFLTGRQALLRGETENAIGHFDRVAQSDPGYVVDSPLPRKSIWTYVGRAHYNSGRYQEARVAFDKALSQVKDDYVARLYRGLTMLRVQTFAPSANAFTLQEISYALREGVAPRRVGTIARERGVAFDLNAETENQLKNSGADAILLGELRKLRAERTSQSKPSDNQRSEGAKEIATALTGLRDWIEYLIAYTAQGKYWDPGSEIRGEIAKGVRATIASKRDWDAIVASAEWVGYRLEEENDRARRDERLDLQRLQR